MSFYVWKIKITWDSFVANHYRFGCSYTPAYNQFVFYLGKRVLYFWYRKDLIR